MIINIRGTNGSGKTMLVRQFLKDHPNKMFRLHGDIGIGGLNHKVKTPYGIVYVIGSYNQGSYSGGCDNIKTPYTQDDLCNRIRTLSKRGHVIFEGIICSTIYQRYADLCLELGKENYVWAFLDTPLKTCIKNIEHRRAAAGKHRVDFKRDIIKDKYESIQRVQKKALAAKFNVWSLEYPDLYKELITILSGE